MENGKSKRSAAIIHKTKKVVFCKRLIPNARTTTMNNINTPPVTLI